MKIKIEIELEIDSITYTPAEKEVRYYSDGSGYPGSPAEIDWKECKLIVGKDEFPCPDGLSELFYDEIIEEYERQMRDEL